MMKRKIDIEWFYAHLFAYRDGALGDADAKRMKEILAESSDCRDALEAATMLERVEKDSADLPPTGVLARWREIEARLDDEERELMVQHLEHSEETRQDLSLLGIDDPAAGLKRARAERMSEAFAEMRDAFEQRLREAVGPVLPRFRRWIWGLGAYAAAATAVIVFLVARGPDVAPPPVTDKGGLSAPLHILRTTRGAEPERIAIARNAPVLLLSPSGVDLSPDRQRLRVRLTGADGEVIHASEAGLGDDDTRRRLIVVVPNPGRWTDGSHLLSIEDPRSGEVLAEYLFTLDVE